MDRGLLYNQSGIKDETAYKAIMRTGKGKENMKGYEINKGEIWEVEGNGYGAKLVVVLSCYEKYAATVMLQDQEPGSNAVTVRARNIMYADAGRLGWTFYDKMADFVRKLSEEEDQQLRQAIGAALEIPEDEAPLESMAADANREIDGLQYEIAQLRRNLAEAKETIERQEREREEEEKRIAELVSQQATIQEKPGYVELVEEYSLREDLAAARQEAEIYKGLYERLLDKALG